jgi:hypothetical protein
MSTENPKQISIVITDAVKFDGQHRAVGEVLKNIDYPAAAELVGAGRARLATDEDIAAAGKPKKADKPADKPAE